MGSTLAYDGDCGFCTRSAQWVQRRVLTAVEVQPSGAVDLGSLDLTVDEVTVAAWWVDDDGRRWRGHLAIARALGAIGGWWAVPGWLARTPPTAWLAAGVYALVARYRHRLPGGTAACRFDAPGGVR